FFKRLKICSKKDTIAVAIEPLTQADVVSANPIPIYATNFVGGALAGIITSLFQLVNNAPGTASPIPGHLVLFGFYGVVKITVAAVLCGIVTIIVGLIGIATSGFGILPGFFAGYVCAFVVKFLEKKLPAGVEFLAILFIAAPISRGMA
ncbi:PTS sugar transporter subunit IIC, partial [Bacillus sp. JEM-1]|uniref:PTS sugar transporter subunit IIC n=1 Tax=Bacillus sp. JEM-1 TaxID=1977090 RepID=UPI001F0B5931